jgi:hypothetical protein
MDNSATGKEDPPPVSFKFFQLSPAKFLAGKRRSTGENKN